MPIETNLRPDQVALDRDRMFDMMETMVDTSLAESLAMLCFALSLLYRSGFDEKVTMIEFTDSVGKQVRGLIANPPEGFEENNQPTPGCDCEVCEEKRERLAHAH